MRPRLLIGLAAVAVAISAGWWMMISPEGGAPALAEGAPMVPVTLPAFFSAEESVGETAFNAKCAACNGENVAVRSGLGPPPVHKIYDPGHHGDDAFEVAAQNFVQAHHWSLGNMPPPGGLTPADIGAVTAYVREVQRANGIE